MKTNEVLLNLINRFKNGENISLGDIQTFYSVSERTARRYIYQISDMLGLNIEKNKTTGKYYISEMNVFSLLNDKEELALNMIIENSKSLDKDSYDSIIKLLDKFKDSIHQNIFYSKVEMESIKGFESNMILVEKAIKDKHIMECTYNGKDRRIKPLKLACFDGYWYLVFKDNSGEKIKKFYFKDIKHIKVLTNQTFDDSSKDLQNKLENAINAYFEGDGDSFIVHILVEKDVAQYFLRKPISKSQRIVRQLPNGSIEIELMISHPMEIIPTIQKYMPYIKVISPEEIWDIILKNACSLGQVTLDNKK